MVPSWEDFTELSEYMSAREQAPRITGTGIPDKYVSQGTQAELREECGLSAEGIYKVLAGLNEKNLKKD